MTSRSGQIALIASGLGLLCFLFLVGIGVANGNTDSARANTLYLAAAGVSSVLGLVGITAGARTRPKTSNAAIGMVLGVIDITAYVWGGLAVVLMSCATGGVACT